MQPTNYHTYNEIKTQTEAWAQALDVIRASDSPKAGDYDQVIFYGCGSTYYFVAAGGGFVSRVDGAYCARRPCE